MVLRRNIEQAVGIAVLALLAAGTFLILRPFLTAVLWAVVLTYSTWPLYRRLKYALGDRQSLAAALMVSAVTCMLVAPVAVLGLSMADDVVRLTDTVRGWLEQGLPQPPAWIAEIPLLGTRLSARWHEQSGAGANLLPEFVPYLKAARSELLKVGAGIAYALFELMLSLAIAFFLYRDGPSASIVLGLIAKNLAGVRGNKLIGIVASTIRSVVSGLLGANLLQAILGGLGFWFAGIPAALLLGFFLFFLTVIPFGAGLIWVPAVLWLLSSGNTVAAVSLTVWCIIVFPTLENVVRLYLVQRGSSLPGLLILLGMLGGISAFGFLGVFLGPAVLALSYTLIDEWVQTGGQRSLQPGDQNS